MVARVTTRIDVIWPFPFPSPDLDFLPGAERGQGFCGRAVDGVCWGDTAVVWRQLLCFLCTYTSRIHDRAVSTPGCQQNRERGAWAIHHRSGGDVLLPGLGSSFSHILGVRLR